MLRPCRSPVVQMSTAFSDPAVKAMKKKNAKTGSSAVLKGYTVGSLAPLASVSSGNKAVFGYGIDNRFGGKAKVSNSSPTSASGGGKITLANAQGVGSLLSFTAVLLFIGSAIKF